MLIALRPSLVLSAVVALAVMGAFTAPQAQAGFAIGTAANYGVLIEPGAHSLQLNNSTVTGNVGIGSGLENGGVQIASNGFITGQLQLADSSASVSNPANVSGGVFFNRAR